MDEPRKYKWANWIICQQWLRVMQRLTTYSITICEIDFAVYRYSEDKYGVVSGASPEVCGDLLDIVAYMKRLCYTKLKIRKEAWLREEAIFHNFWADAV